MPTNPFAKLISSAQHPAAPGFVLPLDQLLNLVITTVVFSVVGLILFAFAFWIIIKVSPFSIRKELEEDQNIALGIVIASVIIGIGLIVSAAVHG